MIHWLRLEWRELRRSGTVWMVPVLAAAAAAALLPPVTGAAALVGLAGTVAVGSTARRIWREWHAGGLRRLRLTPVSGARLLLPRLVARAIVLALQFLPILALTAWRQLSPQQVSAGGAAAALPDGAEVLFADWLLAAGLGTVLALCVGVAAGALLALAMRRLHMLNLAVGAVVGSVAAAILLLLMPS